MSDYILEAEAQINNSEEYNLIWFSFWAMIALRLSQKYKFNKVFLCSLSPYFSEDLFVHPKYYKSVLWIKRWKDFENNYSEKDINNHIGNDYKVIYWSDETKWLKTRTRKIIDSLTIKDYTELEWVKHDISDKRYIRAILKNI